MKNTHFAVIVLILIAIVGGCDTSDQRAVQLATDSADRQAEQNQVVADLGREMSDNHTRIVEAVANSRSELVSLQKEVAEQRERLDAERKAIAGERRYESFLAAIMGPAGWILLAALPLALCWLVLSDLRASRSDEDAICQILVDEFVPRNIDRLPTAGPSYRGLIDDRPADGDQTEPELPF